MGYLIFTRLFVVALLVFLIHMYRHYNSTPNQTPMEEALGAGQLIEIIGFFVLLFILIYFLLRDYV